MPEGITTTTTRGDVLLATVEIFVLNA